MLSNARVTQDPTTSGLGRNIIKLAPNIAICRLRLAAAVITSLRLPYSTFPLLAKRNSQRMPTKRKIPESQSLATHTDAPRRSSRRIKEAAETENVPPTPAPGIIIGTKENGTGRNNGYGVRDGVDRVMQDLSEMEQRFQNAVKRQRLAVESSDLGCEDKSVRPEVVEEQPLKATKAVINEKSQDQTASVEKAPLDTYEAELAVGDVADASVDDEIGADRGARRQPPVNSAVLPLPWKGRLGYVSAILVAPWRETARREIARSCANCVFAGLSEHLPQNVKSTGIFFENVSHSIDHRT